MTKYLIKTECAKDGCLILGWLKDAHFDKVWHYIAKNNMSISSDFIPMFIEVIDNRRMFEEWFSLKLEQPNAMNCGVELFLRSN